MLGLKRWLGLMVQGLLARCSGCNPSLSELSLVLEKMLERLLTRSLNTLKFRFVLQLLQSAQLTYESLFKHCLSCYFCSSSIVGVNKETHICLPAENCLLFSCSMAAALQSFCTAVRHMY